jgi:hypothetical protein
MANGKHKKRHAATAEMVMLEGATLLSFSFVRLATSFSLSFERRNLSRKDRLINTSFSGARAKNSQHTSRIQTM